MASGNTASASPEPIAPGVPNPTLRLDAALGLVVIEFVSKEGTVTTSIPSQRELNAYQDGTAELPGTRAAHAAQQQQQDQQQPPAVKQSV